MLATLGQGETKPGTLPIGIRSQKYPNFQGFFAENKIEKPVNLWPVSLTVELTGAFDRPSKLLIFRKNVMIQRFLHGIIPVLLAAAVSTNAEEAKPKKVSFYSDIRPIFRANATAAINQPRPRVSM